MQFTDGRFRAFREKGGKLVHFKRRRVCRRRRRRRAVFGSRGYFMTTLDGVEKWEGRKCP